MQDVLASIGVKKALPFTKFLNYELNKLRESGVLQNVLAIPKETCPLDENLMPITFSKTVFLFTMKAILCSGLKFRFYRCCPYWSADETQPVNCKIAVAT